jgi:hypothetical protein
MELDSAPPVFQYVIHFREGSRKAFGYLAHHHSFVKDTLRLYSPEGNEIDWFAASRVKYIDISEWDTLTGEGPRLARIEDWQLVT